jgi:GNAT superfamily N-acetyltransferase
VRATTEDVDVCFGIARASALEGFRHIFPPERYSFPDEPIRADWLSALASPGGETYLALLGDDAVGVVSLGDGLLQTLYVLPESWGHGVGGALHDLAVDRLRNAGVREARLWTLVENHRARAFYERRGWALTGRTRPVPYPPHPIDVEYALRLDGR